MSQMIKLTNANPTAAEKDFFKYAGLYPLNKYEYEHNQTRHLRYIGCHFDKIPDEYPEKLLINENDIDYNFTVIFYDEIESVEFKGLFDTRMFDGIRDRAKELNWK